jgi:flagellar protein FlaJ
MTPDEGLPAEHPPEQFTGSELGRRRPLSDEEYRRFREEYGYLRAYFKARPQQNVRLQRWLNKSHMGTTFEMYLARSVQYALLAGLLGALLGALLTLLLSSMGALAGLESPISVGSELARVVSDNRLFVVGSALTLGGGGLFAGATWGARYYYPKLRMALRRQEINVVLPQAIVYMYALSYGGTSLFETLKSLADSRDTYGEVANEFEMVINDVELFGTDMFTAIRNARRLTPSEPLERFLDDLLNVLESGGDITVFLEEESETYLREAREEQRNFLETISLLAEVFVVLFVAAPLFLIVTLVVIDILGGNSIATVSLLVYAVMPLAMAGFILLVDILGQPFVPPEVTPAARPREAPSDQMVATDSEQFDDYRRNRRLERLRDTLRDPRQLIRVNPLYSLAATLPLAALLVGIAVGSGVATPSLDALRTAPVATTTALFIAPFLVVAVPLSVFHELKRHREQAIAREFPETLNVLASANRMGITLTESLELISQWSTGITGEELRKVRNDIVWNHDVRQALLEFADRVYVPQLSRSMKLLAEGIYASGDLSKVLSIAASDTRNRSEMERARRNELTTYIAVVVIGFFVYLLVVLMLDIGYLQTLSRFEGAETAATGNLILGFSDVPVQTYRAVFFHSALIQGIGTGLLAGKLGDNNALTGLKYGIALTVVTLGAFLLI